MTKKTYRGKTAEQIAAELAELGHEGAALTQLDDETHATIQALVEEITAGHYEEGEEPENGGLLGPSGQDLWDRRDSHPLTDALTQVVSDNAVAIAYNYIHESFARQFLQGRLTDRSTEVRDLNAKLQAVKDGAEKREIDRADEIAELESQLEELKTPRSVLTVKQAAEELRCSQTAVRDMIKSGRLKAMEIGTGTQRKAYTIRRSDLEALAKVHDEQPAKPRRRNTSGNDDNRWGI